MANTNIMQKVSGVSVACTVIPTISASVAYSALDQVGQAPLTLIGAATQINSIAILSGIIVCDDDKANADLVFFFYKSLPTITSVDNGAFTLTDANNRLCVGHKKIVSTDYISSADNSVGCLPVNQTGIMCPSVAPGGHLYCAIMCTGTPTYNSTTSLQITFLFSQEGAAGTI